MTNKTVFFRNDDVRGTIDQELITLVDIFTAANVPISLAVEPANVTQNVVNWLLEKKNKYPDVIEFIQHGYNHNKDLAHPPGTEFGTTRKFEDQYDDIEKGKELMNKYFKNQWFPAMAFPYGSFNPPALSALNKLGFKVMSAGASLTRFHRIKDSIGKMLGKDFLQGKKVMYHNQLRNSYQFMEFDTSINIIKKYINEEKAHHFSLEKIIDDIKDAGKHTSVIGILFHHRFHTEQLNDIVKLVDWLKNNNYQFSTLENLYHASQNKSK